MEPKAWPALSPVRVYHNTGRGALEQGCWRNEGRHCGRQARGGRVALLDWVLQRPPLRHGSHLLSQQLHFNQRHSAHFSRVPQASVQLLTRCPGIFLVFIKFHHALTFPQHTKNALGEHTEWRSWHSVHAYCPERKSGGEFSELLARQTRNEPTHPRQPGRRDFCWFSKKGPWQAKQMLLQGS